MTVQVLGLIRRFGLVLGVLGAGIRVSGVFYLDRRRRRDVGDGVYGVVLAGVVIAIRPLDEELRRDVHLCGDARIRFSRNGAAQPDDESVLGRQPTDHEQTHVPRGVRVDLAAGLQAHVGHPQAGVGHAQPAVADLDDEFAVAGVRRRNPHLRDRRRVPQRVV